MSLGYTIVHYSSQSQSQNLYLCVNCIKVYANKDVIEKLTSLPKWVSISLKSLLPFYISFRLIFFFFEWISNGLILFGQTLIKNFPHRAFRKFDYLKSQLSFAHINSKLRKTSKNYLEWHSSAKLN